MKATAETEKQSDNREYWLQTYADMVTLLLCFFIILFTSTKKEEEVLKAISLSLRGGPPASPYIFSGGPGVLDQIEKEFQSSKLLEEVTLTTDDRGIVVQLGEATLFNRGSALLRPESATLIAEFAKLINVLPNSVVVEGYSSPAFRGNRYYPSPWELASVRASKVARELEANGVASERIEVLSYGSTRIKVRESPDSEFSINDRVEILIRPDDGPRF